MPAAEVLGLRKQLEAHEATQGGQLQAVQRSRAFLLFKWLDRLIRDPRVLDPIEQLIGPDILCWSTIFWIKDAGSRSFVSWHQDNTYWGLSSRNVATAWFAISDASVEAGCMNVLPGSHLGRTLDHEDTYHEDNMLTRGQAIKEIDESRAVSMPLKAGEMSIHNYCLAHGSGPNLSGDSAHRRVDALHAAADQAGRRELGLRGAGARRGPVRPLRADAGAGAGFRPGCRRVPRAGGEGDARCPLCGGGEEAAAALRHSALRGNRHADLV